MSVHKQIAQANRRVAEKMADASSQFFYGIFLNEDVDDSGLSQIVFEGATVTVPRLKDITPVAGDLLLLVKPKGLPLTILGVMVGTTTDSSDDTYIS